MEKRCIEVHFGASHAFDANMLIRTRIDNMRDGETCDAQSTEHHVHTRNTLVSKKNTVIVI